MSGVTIFNNSAGERGGAFHLVRRGRGRGARHAACAHGAPGGLGGGSCCLDTVAGGANGKQWL